MSQGKPPVRRSQPLPGLLLSPRFSYLDLAVGAAAAVVVSKVGVAVAIAVLMAGALVSGLLVGRSRRASRRRG